MEVTRAEEGEFKSNVECFDSGKEKYEINWEMLFVTFKEEAKEMNGEVVAAELVILGFSLGLKEVYVMGVLNIVRIESDNPPF